MSREVTMKVAVKKRVLFNLLKSRLNEDRMPGGDHGGRVIHPFNIQSPNSDPFGFYEDEEETPIKVSDHMAVQLSVPKMPVEDENFLPGTITELCNSAILICEKVPQSQIEYFYRQLHLLLDNSLDRDDESQFKAINEAFNISKKTTIKDFDIITESSRIKLRRNAPLKQLPAELQPEDLPGYSDASDKDEYMRGYNFAADFEVEGKSEDELEEHENYVNAQTRDFITGYDVGNEVATGIQIDPGFDRPLFAQQPGEDRELMGKGKPYFRSLTQFLARGTEIDPKTGEIDTSVYDEAPPRERAAMDTSAALQEFYKKIDAEATAIMMEPKMAAEFGALMTPLTQEFGLSSQETYTPLNVSILFKNINQMKDQPKKLDKIKELEMLFFVVISESVDIVLKKSGYYRRILQDLAKEDGMPFDQFMIRVKQDVASSYVSYGGTSKVSPIEDESEESAVVREQLNKLFAAFILSLKLPGTDNKFKNRKHFRENVDLNSQDDILDGFSALAFTKFEDKNNPGLYIIRDKDVTIGLDEEELSSQVEIFITKEFLEADKIQNPEKYRDQNLTVLSDEPVDISDEESDEISEIDPSVDEIFMSAAEKAAERHAAGKKVEWQDLAPFFGYGGTAGIRQYYLGDVRPLLQLLSYK